MCLCWNSLAATPRSISVGGKDVKNKYLRWVPKVLLKRLNKGFREQKKVWDFADWRFGVSKTEESWGRRFLGDVWEALGVEIVCYTW